MNIEYDIKTLIVVLACVRFRANTFFLHLWQQFDHRNEEKRGLSRAAGGKPFVRMVRQVRNNAVLYMTGMDNLSLYLACTSIELKNECRTDYEMKNITKASVKK